MLTHNLEALMEHKGSGWSKDVTTTVFTKDEYTVIEISDTSARNDTLTTVTFRNVAELNPDSAIQFEVTEYRRKTNRTTNIGFAIPACMSNLFLKSLAKVKPAK